MSEDLIKKAVKAVEKHFVADLMRLIREQGVDPNSCTSYGDPLLHLAAGMSGRHKTVCKLVRAGADINKLNKHGGTALHRACEHGYEQNIQSLMKFNPNINIQDQRGYTPLMIILVGNVYRHKPLIQLYLAKQLIDKGADLTLRQVNGLSMMDLAGKSQNHDLINLVQSAYEMQCLMPSIQGKKDQQISVSF